MGKEKDTSLDDIKEVIERFDKEFDDPYEALQEIAEILGIKKSIAEYDDDDDDDEIVEDDEDDYFDSDDD